MKNLTIITLVLICIASCKKEKPAGIKVFQADYVKPGDPNADTSRVKPKDRF